jgi:hypothetical protein
MAAYVWPLFVQHATAFCDVLRVPVLPLVGMVAYRLIVLLLRFGSWSRLGGGLLAMA